MEKLNSYTICELDTGGFVIETTYYDDGINDEVETLLQTRDGETEFVTYSEAVTVLATHLLTQVA
jgi:hypothetical protein